MKTLKVLLGGLPLGRNNSGVEAIVRCVAEILRRLDPEMEITVSTEKETAIAAHLGVKTIPLYGFSPKPALHKFAKIIADFDLFIWCGANGLSDYPETGLNLLLRAQKQGVQTALWGIGMDSDLKHQEQCTRRQENIFSSAARMFKCNLLLPFARRSENRRQQKIRLALENCLLVVVRDPETALALTKCGFSGSVVGADSAMLLPTAPESPVLKEAGIYKIAFCLSSQSPLADPEGMRELWERLCAIPAYRLVLIPTDCQVDCQFMQSLCHDFPYQERIQMLSCNEPELIQAAVANCDVVVSSRLTLLILAANVRTPIVGIEHGGKIGNWLRIFELRPVGTTDKCDFERIEEAICGFKADAGAAFRKKADFVYSLMRKRLALAEAELQSALEKLKSD